MRARVVQFLLAALLAVVGVLTVVPPLAHAFVDPGVLLVKGPGSTYSSGFYAGLSAAPGKSVSFGLKVVNTGDQQAQYRISVNYDAEVAGALYDGSRLIYKQKYWTPSLEPGESKLLTVKMAVGTAYPQGLYAASVDLYSAAEDDYLESHALLVSVAAPARGTGAQDMFVRNGSQKWIGGSTSGEMMSAPAVKLNGSAVYTVRLQNDGPTLTTSFPFASAPQCPGVTRRWTVNGVDQTANIEAGVIGWGIQPGAHKDLKLTLKYATAPAGCTEDLITVSNADINGTPMVSAFIHLPIAA